MSNFNELNLSPLKEFKQAMENAERRGRVEELKKIRTIITDWDYSSTETGEEALDLLYGIIEKRLLELEKGELK